MGGDSMNTANTSSLLIALPAVAFGMRTAAVGPRDEALEDLEYGDWSRAFEVLVSLADSGDCEAARLSLMMHEHGARLFGGSFPATPCQCSRWLAASQSA